MTTKNRRITVTLPASVLKDVVWLAPLEDMTRDELILEAIKRFLKPHLEIRKQVLRAVREDKGKTAAGLFDTGEELTSYLKRLKRELKKRPYRVTKAISESTEQFKTGRYDAPQE